MELAKSGNIGKICVPNALSTFEEYLLDFASDGTKYAGEEFLMAEVEKESGVTKNKAKEMIGKIKSGERDVYL